MKKLTTACLVFILISLSFQTAFAGQTNDWNAVKSLIDQEIAVKTRAGKTHFGVLRAAGDDELQLNLADKKSISSSNTTLRRDEVAKVWRARLHFGGRQIGKGALIGLGAGAAIGTGIFLGTRKSDSDGLAGAVIPLTMFYGAGIGALAGIFTKKSHKKENLIYSV